ncbi:Gag-pol Polyprotein [Phytophthora palmivora]|uniref:Gag-pol Polyprotein n=1 Tax=Phytophthora palmivora TaxID=4796 RepID=A0A2P4YPJ1_9STRA|nr:Gag-pol Polyprotein [Phytophthora palmivora]
MSIKWMFLRRFSMDRYLRIMQQPHGFRHGDASSVCKLKKSLYGLKPAPRIWVLSVQKGVLFVPSKVGVLICVYADDITIAASSMILMQKVKAQLASRFTMKDLGDVHYLLKMEIKSDRTNKILSMSHNKYIMNLLQKFEMTECSSEPTPQAKRIRGTRPDIANAVRELSKFLSCYNKSHYKAAQRVLKYLKGTSTYGLIFDGKSKEVIYELYTDASFRCHDGGRTSVTGYVSIMADACITWKSSRQSTMSIHTAQAELIAASEGIKESEWLWVLLEELGYKQTQPMVCWCDNKGAISIIKDPANHTSTKHIDIKGLYAREIHDKGRIVVSYCNTNDMIADALTKALPRHRSTSDKRH